MKGARVHRSLSDSQMIRPSSTSGGGRLRAPKRLIFPTVCCLLLAACAGPTVDDSTTEEAIPPWIVSVEPRPGQDSAPLSRVEVKHRVQSGGESVRLEIDGTDVTAYSDFGRADNTGGPGRLVYDPETPRVLVPLDPGEHEATLKRVQLIDAGERHRVLDTFTWSFTIQ